MAIPIFVLLKFVRGPFCPPKTISSIVLLLPVAKASGACSSLLPSETPTCAMRKCCIPDDFSAFVVAASIIGVAIEIGVTVAACTCAFLSLNKQCRDTGICACSKLADASSNIDTPGW